MLVCFASEKGGVGKTTLAALLAERLSGLGHTPHVADGDRQASLAALAERSKLIPAAQEVFPMQFARLAAQNDGLTLLDLPSGIGVEFNTAMAIADVAIVPVVPSAFDLRTLPATLRQIRKAQELRGGSPRTLIVPNKIDLREGLSKELLEVVQELGWPTTRTWLSERSAYRRMGNAGLDALPRNVRRAAEVEVAQLVDEIVAWLDLPAAQEVAA